MDKPTQPETETLTTKTGDLRDISEAAVIRRDIGVVPGQWQEIKSAGLLTDESKPKIISAIESYKRQRTATKPTRDKVEQVRSAIYKAFRLLGELTTNEEFLYVGTGINGEGAPDIDAFGQWYEYFEKIFVEMDKADARFDDAPRRLIFPAYGALEDFVFEVLLMTQALCIGKPPPTYYKQSSTHPQFERFVYLCAQAADPELEADYPTVRNEKIERALLNATRSFNEVRTMDSDGWAANWNLESPSRK
jgi:hypothetical protein